MEKAERDAILRQGVVLPVTPRQRREHADLEEDLLSLPQRGRPLRLRRGDFRPTAESYVAAGRGPLAYMLRLREIETRIASHEEHLADARRMLALGCAGDEARFGDLWRAEASAWSFDEVNDLIDRHNRWYPVESRLPMDPRTGDYALVNGRDYRLAALDADWILAGFPAALAAPAPAAW